MSKISLTNLVNLQNETTAVNAINGNNATLTTALDNTLSRDGTSPNQMLSLLDMNSKRIINLPAANSGDQPLRKAEFDLIANTTPTTKTFLGTNNEINISTNVNTLTWSLPTTLDFTGKTVTNSTLTSPIFTGTPVAPTPSAGDNSTKLATTAFVLANTVPSTNYFIGTGADQTAALQALVDAVPDIFHGVEIVLQGNVVVSSLNLSGKRHITFRGIGSGQIGGTTTLTLTTGAVGAGNPAINCRQTVDIRFKDLSISANNAAFNGSLIDCGGTTIASAGSGCIYMKIDNCSIGTTSASAVCLSMYGATNGKFSSIDFEGPGTHIKLQDDNYTLVGYVNANHFDTITFEPSGTNYCVVGSAEALTFTNCCWEPCVDGRMRAIATSSNRPFKAIQLIGCSTFDATVTGFEAFLFPWGFGLSIIGGLFGGPGTPSYAFALGGGGGAHPDPGIRGLGGVVITGGNYSGLSAIAGYYGTAAANTNVRGISVLGNSIITGSVGSSTETRNSIYGPNNIYDLPTSGLGAFLYYPTIPEFADRAAAIAGGLTTNQIYVANGVAGVRPVCVV